MHAQRLHLKLRNLPSFCKRLRTFAINGYLSHDRGQVEIYVYTKYYIIIVECIRLSNS